MAKLPRPPINNMTEFVVFCFVTVVVLMLIGTTAALVALAIIDPEGDRGALVNILTDTMNTIIGALIGFVAGKGQGRSEVHDEQAQERREEREFQRQDRSDDT